MEPPKTNGASSSQLSDNESTAREKMRLLTQSFYDHENQPILDDTEADNIDFKRRKLLAEGTREASQMDTDKGKGDPELQCDGKGNFID